MAIDQHLRIVFKRVHPFWLGVWQAFSGPLLIDQLVHMQSSMTAEPSVEAAWREVGGHLSRAVRKGARRRGVRNA